VKKTLITLAAVGLLLAGCASPRTASIESGKITNLTSAEALTLAKQDIRQKKVADVQKNAKPLIRLEAHAGQPITINAKVFEVNAPQDIRELLAEQASEVSENLMMFREVRGVLRETVVPMAAIGWAADVAKRRSDNARQVSIAEIEADAQTASESIAAASKDPLVVKEPVIVTVPEGSAVLTPTPTPTP
jgi:cell division protein ZapA (FtsZ GTPase activity inhibitor)